MAPHLCFPSPLPQSSCLLRSRCPSLPYILKGSSSVRYPFYVLYLVSLLIQVQSFPNIGLYSGIFAMYLQCPSRKSKLSIILFYTLCLLYVLSTATFVSDLVSIVLEVSNNSIPSVTYHFFTISWPASYQCTIASTSN